MKTTILGLGGIAALLLQTAGCGSYVSAPPAEEASTGNAGGMTGIGTGGVDSTGESPVLGATGGTASPVGEGTGAAAQGGTSGPAEGGSGGTPDPGTAAPGTGTGGTSDPGTAAPGTGTGGMSDPGTAAPDTGTGGNAEAAASGGTGNAGGGTTAGGAGGSDVDADVDRDTDPDTDTDSDAGTGPNGELFTVDYQLASDIDADAPGTVGIVTWSIDVDSITEAHIEFGLDTEYGTSARVDLNEADFRTLLLGMKPDSAYHFRIVATDGATTYASDDYVINTGPPTNLVSLGAFNVLDESSRERGFIVTSYWQGQASSMAFIIDADGDIVWWYESNSDGIARARMSEDGKNMWMIIAGLQGGPLERVTMDTLDGQIYDATVGSHDLTAVSGGTMAYLDYGESDCDSIFEIDPSGNVIEVFESGDFLGASGGGMGGMGCHGNALRYSQGEDVYTFSDLNQDVLIVNRSGSVDWRLSERVANGNQAWGGAQHGHHLLDDSIVIFANRDGAGSSSAAIEYTLDGQEILRYESGNSSGNLGDVQRLPGGNTLVTYSNASIIHEIDSQGNLVLEIDGGGPRVGYTLWRETLYGPPPDISL
jgi:hypothetical protein